MDDSEKVKRFYRLLHGVYGQKFTTTFADSDTLAATKEAWGTRICRLTDYDVDAGMQKLMELTDKRKYEWPDVGQAVKLCESIFFERRKRQRQAGPTFPDKPPVREKTLDELKAEIEQRKRQLGTNPNPVGNFSRAEWDKYLNDLCGDK